MGKFASYFRANLQNAVSNPYFILPSLKTNLKITFRTSEDICRILRVCLTKVYFMDTGHGTRPPECKAYNYHCMRGCAYVRICTCSESSQ